MKQLRESTVLVTGGGGFIGSHIVKRLVNEGATVHVFDKNTKNLADVNVTVHKIDLRNYDEVVAEINKIKPDKIFHLAAYVNANRDVSEEEIVTNNHDTTVHLLKALENIEYDCFINTGTCGEYGNGPTPFKESQDSRPVSPYSKIKAKTTNYCIEYQKRTGKPIIVLRPSLTYGPFQKPRLLIPYIITSVLFNKEILTTKGEQTKEFSFVSDIVEGYIKAATTENAIGEIINIGNGEEYTIKEVISKILELMDSDATVSYTLPCRTGEAMHYYSDNSKAKNLLGCHAQISLEEGLKRTIEWYKQQHDAGTLQTWLA